MLLRSMMSLLLLNAIVIKCKITSYINCVAKQFNNNYAIISRLQASNLGEVEPINLLCIYQKIKTKLTIFKSI